MEGRLHLEKIMDFNFVSAIILVIYILKDKGERMDEL
jgi:hypothetical protein